jgi:ribosome-associated protein
MPLKKQRVSAKKISQGKLKAFKIVELIMQMKARRPVILDVQKISSLCDFFVICSASSSTQVEAICDWVKDKSKENNLEIHHWEKDDERQWVLIDFFDVILHIFLEEKRKFYNIEHLWSEAKRVRISRKTHSAQRMA